MSQQVRQRRSDTQCLDVQAGDSISSDDTIKNVVITSTLIRSITSRRHAIKTIPFILFVYVFGPEIIRLPKAFWVYARGGFDVDELVGPGFNDLVGNMVRDPSSLIAWDYMTKLEENPTGMAAYKDVILEEFEAFRKLHEVPVFAELDEAEHRALDPSGAWKSLIPLVMSRRTCAAKFFPKTLEAARKSDLIFYSIMFSIMAPGMRIEPHNGFSKFIQTYHITLKVPQEGPRPFFQIHECSGLDVTDHTCSHIERYEWEEGKEFIFDDSFTHWGENPSDEERLVLIMQISRIDFKSWRERFVARMVVYLFTFYPFQSAIAVVKGTEQTCATTIPPS